MNKIIGFFACMLIATNVANAKSVRVGNTGVREITDTTIERGDSEAQYIARDERFAGIFIGAGGMIGIPVYGARDLYANSIGFGWGMDAGVSFRKPKYIYHPGLKFSYQQIYDSGTISRPFPFKDIDIDITHNVYSLAFDNQIKISDDSSNLFGIRNVRDYLTLDIGVAGIDTRYKSTRYDINKYDTGMALMLGLGYATMFRNGFGIVFDTKYYFTNNDITDMIMTIELGIRYTF